MDAGKEFFIYLVAYSSHYEGRLKLPWPCKLFLLSENAKRIYTRDLLTAIDLTKQLRKKVLFFGNPFMDHFSIYGSQLSQSTFSIALLPGSRFPEIAHNFLLILEVIENMAITKYFENIEFNFAIVNSFSIKKINKILKQRNWIILEKSINAFLTVEVNDAVVSRIAVIRICLYPFPNKKTCK